MTSFLRHSRHKADSWKQANPTKIKLENTKDGAKNKTQANAAAKQKLKPEILIPKILPIDYGTPGGMINLGRATLWWRV